jgi:hypothetical protein
MPCNSCRRCTKECKSLYLLKRHLQAKMPCVVVDEDISIDDYMNELDHNAMQSMHHVCDYCGKQYAHATNKYRHEKMCPEREKDILKKQIQDLQKKLSSTTCMNNNLTVNNNNITINILNSFGQESYHHLSDEFIRSCIMNSISGVKNLIEKIHFSEEAPENNNVRMKSRKSKLMEISQGQEWIVKDAVEAMDTMIKRGCRLMHGVYTDSTSGLQEIDVNELDFRIQTMLSSIMSKDHQDYFDLRRRILALIVEKTEHQKKYLA